VTLRLPLLASLCALLLAGCASSGRTTTGSTPSSSGLPAEGVASYYADKFEGRPTASGEIYRASALTAAHRTLPFGTRLRVTHLKSGRTVIVKVNDRGPQRTDRLVDLSGAAAQALGMITEGLARVRIEQVQ